MSIKNKKITELKYFDAIHTFEGKIDLHAFRGVPYNLDFISPIKILASYWRSFSSLCYRLTGAASLDFTKKRCVKKLENKTLGEVARKLFVHDSLTVFLADRLRI